jgi:TPR repeat protein
VSDSISVNELFRLGQFYLDQEKSELATRYLKLAADCGHAEAQFQLSIQLSKDQQDDLAFERLIEAHTNGYGPASRTLIMHYWEHDSVSSTEIDEVIEWYRNSQNTLCGNRNLELAEFLFYCKRKKEGLTALSKAALLDNAEACRKLSLLHLKNEAEDSSIDTGLSLLAKAADLGSDRASDVLIDIYLKGDRSKYFPGIQATVNKEKALKLLEQKASSGSMRHAKALGTLYLEGLWVKADYLLAEKWLREAANGRLGSAKLLLANEYSTGERLPKRLFEAAYWYRDVANDYGDAALKLSKLLASEEFFSADFAECIFWFNRAVEHHNAAPEKIKPTLDFMCNGRFTNEQKKHFFYSVEKQFLKLLSLTTSKDSDAEKGSAAYRISRYYAIGLCVPLDKSLSHYWLSQAASLGLPIAKSEMSNKTRSV